jgi:GNAT superfamily N-acetyltransferase
MTTAEPSAPLRTGWEEGTPSTDTLSLAALRAMADRTTDWAQAAGGRVRRDPGMVLADALSPCLFLNVATVSAVVDPATARAVANFFPAGRPFLLVTPHLTADLRPAGLTPVGHPPFMVRAAGGTAPEPPGSVTITVAEVRDAAGLDIWDRVLAEGFPAPHSPAPPALLGGPARFWLAWADGEPVGTALSYVAHGVVDVEAVATLPGHRRRGVGAALTWAATLADPDLPAVLIASDDGAGVYREMGYLPVTRWTLWCRP